MGEGEGGVDAGGEGGEGFVRKDFWVGEGGRRGGFCDGGCFAFFGGAGGGAVVEAGAGGTVGCGV